MVSIIVVSYNNLEYTKQCIEAIYKHTRNFELIIVDNASTDGTAKYVAEQEGKHVLPCGSIVDIRVILNKENLGFVKANNQGILMAQGNYICLLNNDAVVSEKWLTRMMRTMDSHPCMGIVGPYTNYSAGHQQVQAKYRTPEEYDTFARAFNQKEMQVDFLTGFCMLIKAEVIARCGMLDEDFGMGNFEDNYLCWLARGRGYLLKISNCYVHHYGSSSFKKDPVAFIKLLGRNQKTFLRKTGREFKLSLCMIMGDYEKPELLLRCLDTIAFFVDEICINLNYTWYPDLRKEREIKNLLKEHYGQELGESNIKIIYTHWKEDFSAARNKALNETTGDWVIWLDVADIFMSGLGLREAIAANEPIGDVIFCNVFAPSEDGVTTTLRSSRIFRNNPSYRWRKPIHEDIALSMKEHKARIIHGELAITHTGYMAKGSTAQKNIRNLKIMKRYFKENKSPDSLDYFHLANAYILEGTKASKLQAISVLDQALAIPLPTSDDLWPKVVFLKARIFHDLGDFNEAKEWYHQSIEARNYIESYLGMAEILVAEKNIDAALGYLERMLEIGKKDGFEVNSIPKNIKEMEDAMLYNLGYCYYLKEDYKKAKEYFGWCLDANPKNLKAIDFICDIYRREGNYLRAFNITLQAVQLFPQYFHGWNNLGSFERMNKRYVTAEMFYQRAIALYPDYSDAKKNLEDMRVEWKKSSQ